MVVHRLCRRQPRLHLNYHEVRHLRRLRAHRRSSDARLGQKWIRPQSFVVGHANHPTVTHLYGPIVDILRERHLQTVTLDDAWCGAKGRNRVVRPTPRTA
jgi:hypothetical protein